VAAQADDAVSLLQRLDHVAVVVRSTDEALRFYSDHLGLPVSSSEELAELRVRLTLLDAGNAYVQLVEPLDGASPLGQWLEQHGEGLHHICFGVEDVRHAIEQFSDPGSEVSVAVGASRRSGFVTAAASNGVVVEFTQELDRAQTPPGSVP
jgi:methylmalonyl-CoA/ethylmalonyl-CoA epimerase